MAQLDSIITFSGKLGNVIGYSRDGKHFLRSRPSTVQQTTGTRRAAHRFGVASRKGALIRSAFAADIDIPCDGGHGNRLTKTIIQAGRNNHAGLAGFRFSKHTGLDAFFSRRPAFSRDGRLHIPHRSLHHQEGFPQLEVKVIATRIDFAGRRVTGNGTAVLYIDLQQPFEGADIAIDVPGKGTLIITMQVRGFDGEHASLNRKYQAAEIIAVMDEKPLKVIRKKALPQYGEPQLPSANTAPAMSLKALVKRE